MAASCAGGQAAPVVSSIKRGAALRLTYKLLDKPMTIIPDLVAQHPDNRGGIAINRGHFEEEEACHGAVAVEERPGGCAIRVYNLQKREGHPSLAGVSSIAKPQLDEGNWQPAVAGVNAKGKKKIITNGKRKHVGKDDVTEGNDEERRAFLDEERRAFLEAFERDEACRKRDDALMAACLAYESDYSDSDYSDSTTL